GFRLDPDALPRDAVIGLLAKEAVAYLEVNLEAGVQYMIEAFCDEDCDDLDLALLSPSGESVTGDVEDDDVPELHFQASESGRYYLGVKMVACETSLCYFGYRVLRK
nr:hypothetical protein [Actinomycetota bacterium]